MCLMSMSMSMLPACLIACLLLVYVCGGCLSVGWDVRLRVYMFSLVVLVVSMLPQGEEGGRERKKQVGPNRHDRKLPRAQTTPNDGALSSFSTFLVHLGAHLQCGMPFGNPCSHRDTAACHCGSDSVSSGAMQP
ncbi:MAG: hypothetical protein BYD32DRAFT_309432 [Podila humilis]|nr:MAG: hypothetical protein BYD32DRAFT_309432 [Podila humilis]